MPKNVYSYIFLTRKTEIICFLLALTCISLYILYHQHSPDNTKFWDFLEPILGVSTFTAAAAVWVGEAKQDWYNSLPKRLTARFVFKFDNIYRVVMQCHDAHLSGESDIRALGLQLGQQLSRGQLLKFEPFIYQKEQPLVNNTRRYEVVFVLTELPKTLHLGGEAEKKTVNFSQDCVEMLLDTTEQQVTTSVIPQLQWSRPDF